MVTTLLHGLLNSEKGTMSSILNVRETITFDDSIHRIENHAYKPYGQSVFGYNDSVSIVIQNENSYLLPSESRLFIEGKIVNTAKTKATDANLGKNCALFLFSELQYRLNNEVVDHVRNPGITTLLKGTASFTPDHSNILLNAGWGSVANIKELVDSKGHFNFCIPLKMIFGFCEDYKKIILNARHELVLIRNRNDTSSVLATKSDPDVQIILEKVWWEMPHVHVADKNQIPLWNILKNDRSLRLAFRHWDLTESIAPEINFWSWQIKFTTHLETARYVILGFQVDREAYDKDSSIFDSVDITNLKVYLNSVRYPEENFLCDFETKTLAHAYDLYSRFQPSYYIYNGLSNPLFSPIEFHNNPIFVIDCSHQNESIKSSIIDVKIEIETKNPFKRNTMAYCLVIHDVIIDMNPTTNRVIKRVQI
ncbi:uncharacterized protein LOC124716847 [Schistocerca piceifrons]|uniref:uncharacterized protein LOC124716847 n=1 Tax=Schistocerca piceifrons TaxID=274613 RepID=UPI001F5FB5DF|nr:uncharacterized protein LOC124716847 [Schistocerca piceifrons]